MSNSRSTRSECSDLGGLEKECKNLLPEGNSGVMLHRRWKIFAVGLCNSWHRWMVLIGAISPRATLEQRAFVPGFSVKIPTEMSDVQKTYPVPQLCSRPPCLSARNR